MQSLSHGSRGSGVTVSVLPHVAILSLAQLPFPATCPAPPGGCRDAGCGTLGTAAAGDLPTFVPWCLSLLQGVPSFWLVGPLGWQWCQAVGVKRPLHAPLPE